MESHPLQNDEGTFVLVDTTAVARDGDVTRNDEGEVIAVTLSARGTYSSVIEAAEAQESDWQAIVEVL